MHNVHNDWVYIFFLRLHNWPLLVIIINRNVLCIFFELCEEVLSAFCDFFYIRIGIFFNKLYFRFVICFSNQAVFLAVRCKLVFLYFSALICRLVVVFFQNDPVLHFWDPTTYISWLLCNPLGRYVKEKNLFCQKYFLRRLDDLISFCVSNANCQMLLHAKSSPILCNFFIHLYYWGIMLLVLHILRIKLEYIFFQKYYVLVFQP